MELQDLMRLCYNAAMYERAGGTGFDEWWVEYGQDRHDKFAIKFVDTFAGQFGEALHRVLGEGIAHTSLRHVAKQEGWTQRTDNDK